MLVNIKLLLIVAFLMRLRGERYSLYIILILVKSRAVNLSFHGGWIELARTHHA